MKVLKLAALIGGAVLLGATGTSRAATVDATSAALIQYTLVGFSPGTNAVGLDFTFAATNLFDNGETLSYQLFDTSDVFLGSGSQTNAGGSVATFFLFTPLTVAGAVNLSFKALITAPSGSFDLIASDAFVRVAGVNLAFGLGVISEAPPDDTPPSGVPIPPALALFTSGLAGLGWIARRRKKQGA